MTPNHCGTQRGYRRHLRAGEPSCQPCRDAHNAYEKRRWVDAELGRPRMIDPTGTRRRLQALTAAGWSMPRIGAMVGMPSSGVWKILHEYTQVRRSIADRVAVAYEQWCMVQPPRSTRWEKRDVTFALRTARLRGWVPPLAWDDIDNDPEPPAVVAEDHVDEVLVQRIIDGERLPANPAERAEAIRRWTSTGRPLSELERITGWNTARELRRANERKAA